MANQRRVALVTGGAKRVGRAIVEKLAGSGFDVAFTYLTSEREAREFCTSLGERSLSIKADLTKPAEAPAIIFDAVERQFGRLDVLVNSASAYLPGKLEETDVQLMQQLSAIHFQSPLLLAQRFSKMLRSSHGHIVNMVDLLAERPWPEYLAYCATKAALVNLTLGLARSLAPEVTVNGIAPGVVEWPEGYPEAERARYLNRVPLARSGQPSDIANLVHYLCTEGAYINGQIIRVDGGRSIT